MIDDVVRGGAVNSPGKILIIGGYGAFGSRLARRLDAAGHALLIAGRNLAAAAALSDELRQAEPLLVDRQRGFGLVLARTRPALVIDAAGPFQASDYAVAEACIAMRIPYIDLSDGRDFVTGIGVLDKGAKAAGVAIITGASSVPALSGAVARELAAGLGDVDAVDMLIVTSNRASAGVSVARSILSYVGKPMRLWSGADWVRHYGWQDLRRITVALPGVAPLRRRLVANADVPDLDLMPTMLPGRPAVRFQAGTELTVQMLALWLLSWPVRWGWVQSLEPLATLLMPLYRAMLRFGGDRSAMQVRVRAGTVERRWTLIASAGDGPEIPTMAAELIAASILAGETAPGARDAGRELTLAQFAPLFARYAIHTDVATADCD